MKANKKIVKFSRRIDFNVGYLVFIVIILYIIASVIMYATSKKTTIYQVSQGSLALDNVYTGLIIRDENVVKAEYSGTVNYYSTDGDKADKISVIYSVDETGHVSELLEKFADKSINENDMDSIKSEFSNYTKEYGNNNFKNIYYTKKNIASKLNRSHYNVILNDLDDLIEQSGNTTLFHKITSPRTGILMFSTDGYENLTEDSINYKLFDTSEYKINNLLDTKIINNGDNAFRLINSDRWSIYIPLNSSEEAALQGNTKVGIKFSNTDISCNADFAIVKLNGETYGKISLRKYMVNFADKRFINVELTETARTGLKIPVSSVCNKSFYTIPLDYITGENDFIRTYYKPDGKMEMESIHATIYDSDDQYYYVSMDEFSSGDILLKPETNEQFIVGTIGELTGVYCVNKGYAVFKKIDIIDKNNEYYIVRKGATYGLKVYDHIVLDYRTVNENELVN